MAQHVQTVSKINTGLCPHGLPPSACPICSNMGGGSSSARANKPRHAGEMSYHECVMQGNAIRARKAMEKEHKANVENHQQAIKNFQNTMAKLSSNMLVFAKNISNNVIMKPVAFAIKNIVVPIINFIQNIPTILNKLNIIKFEITDKLNAIYGEAKAFVEKKISEFVSVIKSKFETIFKIFRKNNTKDDDTKVDEDKKIFNLKTILHKILRKKKDEQGSTDK